MTQNSPPRHHAARTGRFVWHDLMTTDAAKSQAFYTALFGWQIQEVPMPGSVYRMILCGPGPIGGIVEDKSISIPQWMPYLAVDDADATAAKITEHGGVLCVPPTDIPNAGRFAVVNDPNGGHFSIFQGLPESQGFDPEQLVPGRACWNETYTTDLDKAQAFYSAVFGWQVEKKDMGDAGMYHVQTIGGRQAGGMMKHPMPGAPSCWVVYFLVTDLGASGSKAKELGAKAMMEGMPISGVGKFSMLTDPVGAMFLLFEADPSHCEPQG